MKCESIFTNFNINEYAMLFPITTGGWHSIVTQAFKSFDGKDSYGVPIRYGWLDLTGWIIDDPRLVEGNKDIAPDAGLDNISVEIEESYQVNGWLVDDLPPTVEQGCSATHGEIKNGRDRIKAAIRRGEERIPVLFYEPTPSETPITDLLTSGLSCNYSPPRKTKDTENYIVTGVAAVNSNELPRTDKDIRDWLLNKSDFTRKYPNHMKNGLGTKVINEIIKATEKGNSTTLVLKTDAWQDWMPSQVTDYNETTMENVTILKEDITLYNTNGSPGTFLMSTILPNFSEGKTTYIALTTNKTFVDAAVKDAIIFCDSLTKAWSNFRKGMSHKHGLPFNTEEPFVIVGHTPCFQDIPEYSSYKKAKKFISYTELRILNGKIKKREDCKTRQRHLLASQKFTGNMDDILIDNS